MSYQLLLDATNGYTKIYLIKDDKTISYSHTYTNEQNLSINLTSYIESCFTVLNIGYSDINKIYLVYGPGKFSAMRICAVFVRIWATLYHSDIYLIDKFDYIAKANNCFTIVQSDGNKSFVVEYKNNQRVNEPNLLDATSLAAILATKPELIQFYDTEHVFDNVSDTLAKFKKATTDFELVYLKSPC